MTLKLLVPGSTTSPDYGVGWVAPRTATAGSSRTSLAPAAVAIARLAFGDGFALWGWQRNVLDVALERADGRWAYRTVAVIVARQSGKTVLMSLRAFLGLLRGESIVYTAQDRVTGRGRWLEAADLIEAASPAGSVEVCRSLGFEEVRQVGGPGRFRLLTPNRRAARSYTMDTILVDEAQLISSEFMAAVRPTMSTRPDSQIWMVGSAGDETSVDLARDRASGISQLHLPPEARHAAVFEWGCRDGDSPLEESVWHASIPTLGQIGGVQIQALRDDVLSMPPQNFAQEYLAVWSANPVDCPIRPEVWSQAQVADVALKNPLALGVDVSPDQAWASIALAGIDQETGRPAVMLVDHRSGVDWLQARIDEIWRVNRPWQLVCDAMSPAAEIGQAYTRQARPVTVTTTRQYVTCCAAFVAQLERRILVVQHDDQLTNAALTAVRRYVGDAWAFDRRQLAEPITPLVASALALSYLSNVPSGSIIGISTTARSENAATSSKET